MKQTLLSLLLTFGFWQILPAQVNYTFPVNVLEGLQNGQITATHTNLDIGSIEAAFDGIMAPNNVARSAGINPMVVTLQFNYSFSLTATGIYTDNLESGIWTVESAGTLSELNNKSGSYRKLVDNAIYNSRELASRPVNASGKLLRLTMLRQTGDNYVHLTEWSITATANVAISTLCMKPNQIRLIPNVSFQPRIYGSDNSGNEFPLNTGLTWSSSNPGLIGVDNTGKISSGNALGESSISVSWNNLSISKPIKVVTDFSMPVAEERVAKVALVIIDPPIAAEGGRRFSEVFWSYNGGPDVLANQVRDSMNAVSGGAVRYEIVERFDEPQLLTRFGGTLLTVDSMYKLFKEPGLVTLHRVAEQLGQSEFLYNDLLNKYNFCDKSNNHQIDEIWVYAMPFIGMGEAAMTGTGAFNINGPVFSGNTCTDHLPIMGFNYERYLGCALHNMGHRIETTMYKLFPGQYRYVPSDPALPTGLTKNPFQLFMSYDAIDPGKAQVGNIHFPPNGVENYDYDNGNFVQTYGPNWKRYPFLFNQTETINCSAWGCEIDCGQNFMAWWMRHIPHFKCKDRDGRLNNWWAYVIDYNEGKQLEAQTADCDCEIFEATAPVCASKGVFPWHEWIAGVKLNDLDNPSSKSQYTDFADKAANLSPGQNYDIEVTVGFSYYTANEYLEVWLDKNKNGIFENTENIAEAILLRPADGTPTAKIKVGSIFIPYDASPVQDMRMRVSLKRGGYPTACEEIPFGEVEDYRVNIGAVTPKPDLLTVAWEIIPSNQCSTPPGSIFTVFSGLVRNPVPNASAGPFKVKAWLSKDQTLGSGDILWQSTDYTGIGPNTVLGYGIYTPVPPNLAPGQYYVLVITDADNTVQEIDETNNITIHSIRVGAPDFVLQNLSAIPPSIVGGTNLNFSVQVKNQAAFPMNEISGGFNLITYVSGDNIFGNNDDVTFGTTAILYNEFLNANVVTKNISIPIPGAFPSGVYYLYLHIEGACELVWNNNLLPGPQLNISPGATGQFCDSKSNFPWHEWITKVKIGGVERLSGKNAYSDFTGTVFPLRSNSVITVELAAQYSYYTFDEYWKGWIDYNKNGVFEEPSETVFEGQMQRPPDGANASQNYTRYFSFPDNKPAGNTRMRVSMKRGSFPTPCETLPFGEVEDYTVNISHAPNTCQLQLQILDKTCSDNGTPADPSDDTYSMRVIVSGTGNLTTWTMSPAIHNSYGIYGVPTDIGPFSISQFPQVNLFFYDITVAGCGVEQVVLAPPPCSNQAGPDLTSTSRQISPSSVLPGANFVLTYVLKNIGSAPSGAYRINWLISTDAFLDPQDQMLGGFNAASLNAGQTFAGNHTIQMPAGFAPGSYYLLLVVDANHTVAESNENNNIFLIPIVVRPGSGTPDCNAIQITAGPGKITIAGATAPHVLIKVFRPDWTVAYQCLDNCPNPLIVSGLNSGNHYVEIKLINDAWADICRRTQTVAVIGAGGESKTSPTEIKDRFILTFENLYPNPVSELLTIELFSPENQPIVLAFYDRLGRQVYTQNAAVETGMNSFVVPVSDWLPGMYQVIAFGKNGTPAKEKGRFVRK